MKTEGSYGDIKYGGRNIDTKRSTSIFKLKNRIELKNTISKSITAN